MTQMEQWSILSNVLNYIQHSKFHSINHTLDIKAINKYKSRPNTDNREFKELDFGAMPQKLQEEYMDIYEGIYSEIVSSNRFDENSNISMTYLGRIDKENQHKLKTEESFPISEHGYTLGRLLDGTEFHLLLDMGASKSFMSKSFYMQCKSLHSLPRFASRTQRIQVGNGQCVSVLFIIPIIVDTHGHRFKIYTSVSEIHKNIDLVLGIKNVFQLEGVINTRDCCFKFLNRSEKEIVLKPNEQKLVRVKASFVDEILGMAIIKIVDGGTYSTLLIKLKFMHNKAVLDIVNKGKDTIIFKPGEMIGIIDLRSLGYYKIKQGILQQNLSRYYRFEKVEKLCKYFNKFVNTLKKEIEQKSAKDNYPWLDPDDDRRHMTGRET